MIGCNCPGCVQQPAALQEGDVMTVVVNGFPKRFIYKSGAWMEWPRSSDPYERGREHARRRNKTW